MKIVILGDTHIPKRAKNLPITLLDEVEDADLIIHTGDWQTIDVYEMLVKFAPVEGVYGNVDNDDIKQKFPEKSILNIKDKKIGVIHGHGKGKTTEKRVLESFKDEHLDCILFGHSHIPVIKKVGETLLFNPGSATDKRRQAKYSFGIMIIDEMINVSHVYFSNKADFA